ncbi:MAG: (d)CMP kinase [Candidatus Limnocylindrales bacterium]
MTGEPVRIQKALADAAVSSRRAAEVLVEAGRVTVNGERATLGQRVRVGIDVIAVDGRTIGERPRAVHLALHKPAGVTSTVADRHAERTVMDLVPAATTRRAGRLYPVGRLDRDSEGLILLTNDGEWAQRVSHPSHGIEREYALGVATALDAEQARLLTSGVALEEGPARVRSMRLQTDTETRRLLALVGTPHRSPRLHWYRVVLTQGWKRQVRRMLATVGAPVVRLVRVRIGPVRLVDLAPGEVRELSAAERDGLAPRQGRSRADDAVMEDRARPLQVAIDGPGSSGKSSIGAGAARELGYRFFDTGILYRGLAWIAADRDVPASDPAALVELIPRLEIADDGKGLLSRVVVDGQDVTERLHDAAVDQIVSAVARVPEVREALLPVQREIADEAPAGVILAGRDIGTVVLPDADLKLWLEVSLEERARRRSKQRGHPAGSADERRVLDELRRRDGIDSSREAAPLVMPDGAVRIRTDGMALPEAIERVVHHIRLAERAR